MARAVRWSSRGKSDFRTSVEYIRKSSPSSAQAFLQSVLDAARSLGQSPERGRVVPELEDPEVHEVFVGRYRVLYEVHASEVWIMRVIHGSRDLLLALGRRRREDAERE